MSVAILAAAGIAVATTTHRSVAENRAAAQRDATALLARVAVPEGAQAVDSEPSGDGRLLARPASLPASAAVVDRHAFWIIPASLAAVQNYLEAHRPSPSTLDGTGTSGGPGVPPNETLSFSFARLPRGIGSEVLAVQVVALPGGRTGVRADAELVWIVPRSATEVVPGAVNEIDITRAVPGRPPTLSVAVTARSKVRAIVSMIDQLPAVQPGVLACPVQIAGAPRVTLRFRAARGAAVVAVASENADVTEPTTACDPLSFSVRGRAEPALLRGASFLHAVGRLIGARLSAPG